MKRPIVPALLLLVGLAGFPSPGVAQASLSLELHGGLGVPTGDLGDVSEPGLALGVDIVVDVIEYLAAYGGYTVANFGCDDTSPDIDCAPTEEFDSSGFSLGIRGELPVASNLRPWASLGAVFHDIRLGVSEAEGDTGFEIGLGLELELSHMISVGPQVRYRSYSVTETPPEEPETTTDVGFFTIEVAGRLHFGR